jgi:hypothetical protein
MDPLNLRLAILWIVVMLIYFLGDVLRIISGDVKLGEMDGKPFTQGVLMAMALMMLVPILMVYLSIVLPDSINRWVNIIVAGAWIILNLTTLRGYPGWYDRFLLAVSMIFNGITIYYAWNLM